MNNIEKSNVSQKFESYQEATAFLFSQLPQYQQVGKIAYKADLETTEQLDEYFGHPHRKFKIIHIAGTNGKGSTSHMLAAVLQTAGYRVGLYTSPHLKDFRERIKVNGAMISENEVLHFTNTHWAIIEKLKPSFFELSTLMAFDYFARQQIDIAIVEVGMGGRLDATNIVRPEVSVITNIGLDHTEHLGDTLALVAAEKAGIIKQGVPVVIGERSAETAPVFCEFAKQKNAPLFFAEDYVNVAAKEVKDFRQYFHIKYREEAAEQTVAIDLLGDYQQKNICTVLTTLSVLQKYMPDAFSISQEALEHGLLHVAQLTGLHGRWEIIGESPLIICDTGHNSHGLRYTFKQLAAWPHRQLHIVFGVVADKDLSSIVPLMPRNAVYYFTQANLPRALDASLLAAYCREAGLQGVVVASVGEALNQARKAASPDDIIFVGGSTFVVAEVI